MGRVALHVVGYAATALIVYLSLTHHSRPSEDLLWIRWLLVALFTPSLFRYGIQVLVSPWFWPVMGHRRTGGRHGLPVAASSPRASVLEPAWNEEVGLLDKVSSLVASDYPDLEVVVVDDGSTDATDVVMRDFLVRHEASGSPVRIRYASQPNGGKASALNHALRLSTGEYILTVDADSVVDPDTVSRMVAWFDDPKVMSVAGNVKIGNRRTAPGLVQQLEYLYGFYFKQADAILGAIYIVGGAAAAYRRRVFRTLGGFDPDIITEDIELSTRIQDAGGQIRYAPDAVVWTEGAADVRSLASQRLRWKYGRLITFWRYRHLFFSLRRHHNKVLTLLVLPVALLSELLLLLEPLLLVLLGVYTWLTSDYVPLLAFVIIIGAIVTLQVLTDARRRENLNLLLLVPGVWILMYLIDAVEFQALVRSISRLVRGHGLGWQRWDRQGVFSDVDTEPDDAIPLDTHPARSRPSAE